MKELKNVLLVVNPISGNNDKEKLIDFIESELKKMDLELSIFSTKGENDKEAILEILSNEEVDRILVIGGDGTIKMVAETVIELDDNVPIGIFPEGSANGLALNLEIPSTKEGQLNVALGENIVQMDAIKINEEISLHLSDFGVNAELIQNFENAEIRGKLGYLIQTVPTLIKSDYPFEFEITTKQGIYKKQGTVLSIANCKKYGTGAMINPKGRINDGKFEIIIFKNLNVVDIVKTLTDSTVSLAPGFAESYSCSSAKIKCKRLVPFQIDGEYIGELKDVEVSILKNILSIAVPKTYNMD